MVAAVTGFPGRSRRRPHGGPATSRRYERRRPEKTPLHRIVSENLESWLQWREAAERPVPGYVEEELRGYLECGLLCFGFARAVCMTCRTGFVVGFSWNCGGDIRLFAFIAEPGPIRKILTHLGEPMEPPPVSPARGPPTDCCELVQVHDDREVFQASPESCP